ncbi:MAG: GNAT family N-acetyltransferase [Ilumatobacteraceae bacterium]
MDSSDRLLVADGPPTARSPRARTERASLDNWPFDPSVALLQPIDHTRMIRPDDVAELVERAITEGRRAVRTSALFPGSAASVMAHGFEAIDHLVLMRRTLDSLPPVEGMAESTRPRRLGRSGMRDAAVVDVAAFGPLWGHDLRTLNATRGATASSRTRGVRRDSRLAGFVIAGRTGRSGYLQRLAIDPERRREGLGRLLTVDALRWMHRTRCIDVFVNTSEQNQAALALYGSLGFDQRPERLTVAEIDLTGGASAP